MKKYKLYHLLLIISSVLFSGVGLLWFFTQYLPEPYPNVTFYIFLMMYLIMLMSTAVIFKTKKLVPIHTYIGFRSTNITSLVFAIIIAFLIWGIDYYYQTMIVEIDIKKEAAMWYKKQSDLMVVFFSTVIIVPIIEEMLFRGIILQTLNQYLSKFLSAIILSVAFALIHSDVLQIPILIFASLVYVWLTIKYNSIVPAIIAHIVNNSLTFLYYCHLIGI